MFKGQELQGPNLQKAGLLGQLNNNFKYKWMAEILNQE